MLQLQITDQKDSEVNEKFPYIHQVKKTNTVLEYRTSFLKM